MINKKSLKNLKKFTSKNQPKKKGRPKGSLSVINAIKKVLEGYDEKSKKQVLEIFATAAVKNAMQGKDAYFKLIIERLDGKLPDKAEQTGKDSGPTIFKVIYENRPELDDSDED
ncbi:MAG: hypothetical protein ABR911_12195 [Syntrophales bacterium]